jgi:hypothetical protein
VARFGAKFDAQGVLAGSKDSARCIRYLTKHLTKQIGGCHTADTSAKQQHAARLLDALRYEPCSPHCANWLRCRVLSLRLWCGSGMRRRCGGVVAGPRSCRRTGFCGR